MADTQRTQREAAGKLLLLSFFVFVVPHHFSIVGAWSKDRSQPLEDAMKQSAKGCFWDGSQHSDFRASYRSWIVWPRSTFKGLLVCFHPNQQQPPL